MKRLPKGVRVAVYSVRCQANLEEPWDCEKEIEADVLIDGRSRSLSAAMRDAIRSSQWPCVEYDWRLINGVPWCGSCQDAWASQELRQLMDAIRDYADKHPGASATAIRRALRAPRRLFAKALKDELSNFDECNWALVRKGRGLHLERSEAPRSPPERTAAELIAQDPSLQWLKP